MSQQNGNLTLEQLIPGGKQYTSFVPQNMIQLQFAGDNYIYRKGDNIIIGTPFCPKEELLISIDGINKTLRTTAIDTIKKIPLFKAIEYNEKITLQIKNGNNIYHINPFDKNIVAKYNIRKGDNNLQYSKTAEAYISTNGKTLHLHTGNGDRIPIEKDRGKYISLGANNVHRNEFGIKEGIFWAPSGNSVAFYRMDESKVANYPLINITTHKTKSINIKYPMAGMPIHTVTVGIYNIKNKKTIYLKTGKPEDRYFTNITWSPNENNIYILEVNRKQDICVLVRYNTTNGKQEKTLFTETNKKYVEPEHPLIFIDEEHFIYLSRKDGFRHAYIYNTDGKQLKQLTTGEWEIISAQISADRKYLYINSTEASPIETTLYQVNINTGERKRITSTSGVHKTIISTSSKFYIDNHSNHNTPRTIEIGNLTTGEKQTLFTAKDPFSNYKMPNIECGIIKAEDNSTDIYYRIVKPADIDPTKKYPVIIYVYGGPHIQQITDTFNWGVRGWDIYMAQRGYIIFTTDNRGSANRGLRFESETHHRLGVIELADQMQGIKLLKTLPYIDTDRIGVHGWSFGGFMTLNMMLNHPDIFKTGVSGGAVTNWKYYEAMYGERYMGSPEENKEGYDSANMNNIANKLSGKLLLIHCDNDPVVLWQNTLTFLKSSIKSGTMPDYFVYPGHLHNVSGHDRVHLHEKISRYFDDFLK
ncbi:MAG: DPP IV N-terminal domain-containing protein [Bacteroidales bacterium]